MEWIIIPIVIVLGMMGGQFLKPLRRFGIPIASLTVAYKKKKYREMALLLLGVVLSMGYGENSRLSKLCGGRDWLVRWVYGLLLGGIIAVSGFVYAVIIMPLVWLLHVPFSFKIGKYDFLWEDFIRYSALGICIYQCIK